MQVPGQSNDGASSHDRKPNVEVRSAKEILAEDSWVLKKLGMEDGEADDLADALPDVQVWSIEVVPEESGHGSEQPVEKREARTADDCGADHLRRRSEREFVFQGGIREFHSALHGISDDIYEVHENFPFSVTVTTTHVNQANPLDHARWVVQGPITYSHTTEWEGHTSQYIKRDIYGTGTAVLLPGDRLQVRIKAKAGFEHQMNREVDFLVRELVGMGWVREDASSADADPRNGDGCEKPDNSNGANIKVTLHGFPKKPPKPDGTITRNDVFDWYYRGGKMYYPRLDGVAEDLGVAKNTIYSWHSLYKAEYGEGPMPDDISRYAGKIP